jgi:hypothetical protein
VIVIDDQEFRSGRADCGFCHGRKLPGGSSIIAPGQATNGCLNDC